MKLALFRILAAWLVITGLGLAWGWSSGRDAQERILALHRARALRLAAALTPAEVGGVRGDSAELSRPEYQAIKQRLARLQEVDAQIRQLYLLRSDAAAGRMIFLADAQPPGVPGPLRIGEDFPGAARSLGLAETLRTNQPAAEAPRGDKAGRAVVAYAPILADFSAAPAGILAVEAAADDWTAAWWKEAFRHALYAWLLLGLPYGALLLSQRQREQRAALRNLSEAMEQSQSAVMIVSLDSRIEYANAGLCQQIGYSRRELIGHSWREFQQPQSPDELLAEMVALVRSGRTWRGAWRNRRKNGEVYPVRGAISPVKGRDGRLACFVAVFEDMTEVKQQEDKLRAALSRAEAGDRAKSRFLATMSHEVRTPLNGIVGFTSLLLEQPLSPEQRDFVQTIRLSGEALIQLTSDILDFAKIESGNLKLDLRPANPRSLVEDILELLAVPAAEKKIELLSWAEEAVPAAVLVDEARVRQVLTNLVGNAVKFTPTGSVAVTVAASCGPLAGEEDPSVTALLTFAVRDTGIGIAPEHHARLFRPFSQVDESTTRQFGGTGLGLAISRQLAQVMGGDITLESAAGAGSCFRFTVPVTVVPTIQRLPPDLSRLRVAWVAPRGPFADHLERLMRRWRAPLTRYESMDSLAASAADIAFVALDEAAAERLSREPPAPSRFPASACYAFVPIHLESGLRQALRPHFAQLINKPLRTEALGSLVSGFTPPPAAPVRSARAFGFNVLVVEDNPVNQRLVQRLLANVGCKATVAGNGRLGLEALVRAAAPYDLVLMDLHMPELDGLAAIERIRAGHAGAQVQQIWISVLTADARAEQKEKVVAAGANDYLVKPVGLSELVGGLERFSACRPLRGVDAAAR